MTPFHETASPSFIDTYPVFSHWNEPRPGPSLHPLLDCITGWCRFSPPLPYASAFKSHTPFVTLSTPLSFSLSRSLRPWSNQCRWWIIHSELCRRKLFDWQLYSCVSYIINLALLGIAAMVKAIIGQGKASGLMEWILPLQSHTLSLFFCPFSPPPCFHVSSLSLFTLVCPPEGHCSLISHRAKYNVTQVAFWSVFGWRGCSTIENRSAKMNVAKINDEVCQEK